MIRLLCDEPPAVLPVVDMNEPSTGAAPKVESQSPMKVVDHEMPSTSNASKVPVPEEEALLEVVMESTNGATVYELKGDVKIQKFTKVYGKKSL